MLIVTRQPGESIVIDGATVVTLAVIGREFVELSVTSAGQPKPRVVTLGLHERETVACGVVGIVVQIDQSTGKVRLGFDIPAGLSVVRGDPLDE